MSSKTNPLYQTFLNVPQAAEFLGIRPGTLRNWCSQKKISYYKVGRHVLFDRDELESLIRSGIVLSSDALSDRAAEILNGGAK